jgi:hypothetical protein
MPNVPVPPPPSQNPTAPVRTNLMQPSLLTNLLNNPNTQQNEQKNDDPFG